MPERLQSALTLLGTGYVLGVVTAVAILLSLPGCTQTRELLDLADRKVAVCASCSLPASPRPLPSASTLAP